MKTLLIVVVVAFALVGVVAVGLVGYIAVLGWRFKRRNPHAREAVALRTRVDATVTAGSYDSAIHSYRQLRELVVTYPSEPDLVRYLMGAAEMIARTAADRRDVATANELFRDAREITHVTAMPVLRDLVPTFLHQDHGRALACVELLARLAERYPKQSWIYWSAKRAFSESAMS